MGRTTYTVIRSLAIVIALGVATVVVSAEEPPAREEVPWEEYPQALERELGTVEPASEALARGARLLDARLRLMAASSEGRVVGAPWKWAPDVEVRRVLFAVEGVVRRAMRGGLTAIPWLTMDAAHLRPYDERVRSLWRLAAIRAGAPGDPGDMAVIEKWACAESSASPIRCYALDALEGRADLSFAGCLLRASRDPWWYFDQSSSPKGKRVFPCRERALGLLREVGIPVQRRDEAVTVDVEIRPGVFAPAVTTEMVVVVLPESLAEAFVKAFTAPGDSQWRIALRGLEKLPDDVRHSTSHAILLERNVPGERRAVVESLMPRGGR